MSCAATSGRTPVGAQHGRGWFMRPKRASSANMTRKRRPRAAAARLAFLTASKQHHLDALALRGRKLPSQRCFQPPHLRFAAFDHPFLPNQMVTANHTSSSEDNCSADRAPLSQNSDLNCFGAGISSRRTQHEISPCPLAASKQDGQKTASQRSLRKRGCIYSSAATSRAATATKQLAPIRRIGIAFHVGHENSNLAWGGNTIPR
jgi:hypothetical protein